MAAVLDVGLSPDGGRVVITRGGEVDDHAWLQVRAFFSNDGPDSDRRLKIAVEAFMSERAAFARRLQAIGVGATLDPALLELVQRSKVERLQLKEAVDAAPMLDGSELDRLLRESRFKVELGLFNFQISDLQRLLSLPHGANFSVPGAGKTAVTLAVYEAERVRGRVSRLLIIAPLSAFGSWEDEVKMWLTKPPTIHRYQGGKIPADAEIVLVHYQRLAASYDVVAQWVGASPTMVVLDEAHRMKRGWRGEWGRACLSLAYRAERRDILTGTPAPQSPRDLIALIDFIWPNQAIQILPPQALQPNPSPESMPLVADAIRSLFVRTTKKQLNLPPVTVNTLVLPLAELHQDIYDALRNQYAGQLAMGRRDRVDFIRLGRVVMYLLEAATNPKLLTAGSLQGADPEIFEHPPLEIPPGSPLADLLARYNSYETPEKFVRLMRILRANAEVGRKTLVWSNFVRNIKILERMLARYKPAVVHGAVPPMSPDTTDVTRESEIRRFRKDADCLVLLANPAAMSEGISLHRECHDAVYLERTFNAGQYLQSIDRIHRLGLGPEEETRITFLESAGTIDQTVDARVALKADRLGAMLDDPNLLPVVLPNEDDYGDVIEDDDLAALFAHLRGDDGR